MNKPAKTISPLDKVQVVLKAVPDGRNHLEQPGADFALIFGTGSHGVCTFEKMLFGRAAGEQFSLRVEQENAADIFGHLHFAVAAAVGLKPPYLLHVAVAAVSAADDQEVVKAMARGAGCGGGCGCGCGA